MLIKQIAMLKRMFGWSHTASACSYLATASVYLACSKNTLPSRNSCSARCCLVSGTPLDHGVSGRLTSAWTGIVTSAVTLAIVAATYAFQLAYRDYYTCKSDALTTPTAQACQKLLPQPLRDLPAFRD